MGSIDFDKKENESSRGIAKLGHFIFVLVEISNDSARDVRSFFNILLFRDEVIGLLSRLIFIAGIY